ncbi:MAG TPA: ABC transporter, partial [Actinotalea sp.]|nr:ABC transporter [Actinotalea sp.]
VVVALDSASRVRDGDVAELWFDPRSLHVFDPESGDNLTRDEAEADRTEEENERDRKAALERARKREDGAVTRPSGR